MPLPQSIDEVQSLAGRTGLMFCGASAWPRFTFLVAENGPEPLFLEGEAWRERQDMETPKRSPQPLVAA